MMLIFFGHRDFYIEGDMIIYKRISAFDVVFTSHYQVRWDNLWWSDLQVNSPSRLLDTGTMYQKIMDRRSTAQIYIRCTYYANVEEFQW